MRLHYIQHVDFETPGTILEYAKNYNFTISNTKLYNNENLPNIEEFDILVIMGGPMNIFEYDKYPWLKQEKTLIKSAIDNNKFVIGICLGAQLIADILGAKIYKNNFTEIGWHQISKNNINFLKGFPSEFKVFHWHGDTFDLPPKAIRLFSSEACINQGFLYNAQTLGLQFHFEMTEQSVKTIINNCKDELVNEKYIQSEKEIINEDKYYLLNKTLLTALLNKFLIKK